jgi:hypothetical protein
MRRFGATKSTIAKNEPKVICYRWVIEPSARIQLG